MTQESRSSAQSPALVARVIHAAITSGVVVLFAVFLFLKSRLTADYSMQSAAVLKWVGVGIVFVSALISFTARGRLPARARGASADEWWRVNQPKAVICWATAEGGGLGGVVIGWLIGNTTLMALGAVIYLFQEHHKIFGF